MKNIVYNSKTGETTIVEAPDVEPLETPEPQPTTEEVLTDLIETLVDKGVLY